MTGSRRPKTFRLSEGACNRIEILSAKYAMDQVTLVELAIRQLSFRKDELGRAFDACLYDRQRDWEYHRSLTEPY